MLLLDVVVQASQAVLEHQGARGGGLNQMFHPVEEMTMEKGSVSSKHSLTGGC